jgi:hypothetical protein
MASAAGTVEYLATELARLFAPLADRATQGTADSLLEWLGLRPDGLPAASDSLFTALTTVTSAAADLPTLIGQLAQAIEADDSGGTAAASKALIQRLAVLVQAGSSAASALQTLSSSGGLSATQQTQLQAFAAEFADRLLQRLFVEYLTVRAPYVTGALTALGVIEISDQPGDPPGSFNGPYTRKVFHFDRLVRIATDPKGLLTDAFGWGQGSFDAVALFTAWQSTLANLFEIPAQLLQPTGAPAVLEAFAFSATVDDTASPPALDISLRIPGAVTSNITETAGDWQIALAGSATFAADLPVKLHPFFDVEVDLPTGSAAASLTASFGRTATAAPFLILGSAQGSRLECSGPSVGVGINANFDTTNARLTLDPQIQLQLHGGKLLISGDGADGFIGSLLSGVNLESDFDLGVTWSPSAGIAFVGSAALEIQVPVHVSLGPLDIESLYLRAQLQSDGSVPVELSGAFDASLGPLVASVDRLGLIATLSFPSGGGNIGPANVALNFKPPNGVGLSIDTGVVVGGGYLYIDVDRGQYAGALELVVADWLQLTAIGLIDTKMPDGSPGFSLLVIITATFGSGLQLGYGFMLIGVGGLLGLNRTMLFQPLMDGVRTGAVEGILFPTDVIANAPKIISDLQAIFPPKPDTFLVGPMAKLSWAELITISLGVIIEIPPGDIAILGVLELVLPDEDDAILLLRVNFAGALEFSKKRLYFFASLFDSHILFITLQGEMGLLVDYSDQPNFVVSVGGFHPQFTPPPLPFPTPNRIQLDILNEQYARISADTYFAVTTNTAQVGAHAQIFFGFSAVSVTGEMGFDALFQFSPFHFTVEVTTALGANVFGVGVFSVDIDLTLDGTTPWHIHGKASLSFLFFSIGIPIDRTWGDPLGALASAIAVVELITAELAKVANWRAQLPDGSNLLVTLRQLDPSEAALVLHPVGTLHISQRAVPLDLTIDKVGEQPVGDANRLQLAVSSAGLVQKSVLQEPFAPSQFRNFSDAQKLSQPAYEPQDSGLELSADGTALASGTAITRNVRYDLTVIDTQYRRFVQKLFPFFASLFAHFTAGASVARSPLSAANRNRMQPYGQKIVVSGESYAVANVADNTAYAASSVGFSSKASALDHLDSLVRASPGLRGKLQVLGQYEVAP